MNIYEKINKIQVELKVQKSNYNNFGEYSYRSAEDIFNALKPFLKESKLILLFEEKIRIEDSREILTSIIEIIDVEKPSESIKKNIDVIIAKPRNGNDLTQTTGGSISYARKYLMCGVFAIDNEKDNDATNKHEQKQQVENKKHLTKKEKRESRENYIAKNTQKYFRLIDNFLKVNEVESVSDLTYEKVGNLAKTIFEKEKNREGE